MSRYIGILAILVLISIFPGCEKQPEPLDRRTIRMIDTLAAKEIKILRFELDSLCALSFNTYVEMYVDSILEVRMEEIKSLIE